MLAVETRLQTEGMAAVELELSAILTFSAASGGAGVTVATQNCSPHERDEGQAVPLTASMTNYMCFASARRPLYDMQARGGAWGAEGDRIKRSRKDNIQLTQKLNNHITQKYITKQTATQTTYSKIL